jgi:hypothetical protein
LAACVSERPREVKTIASRSVMLEGVNESAGTVLRWCRALLLATVAFVAGVAAHLGADGLMPGRAALVVLFLTCTAGAAVFLGRPASRLRVVMLLVGGQTFIHGGLTALAGHRGDPPLVRTPVAAPVPDFRTASGAGGRVGSLMDQFYAGQPGIAAGERVQLAVPYPVQHLIADLTGAHAAMALGHLAAAVVVGLWLAMGERALWAVLTLTGDLLARTLDPSMRWLAAAGAIHLVGTAMRDALRRVVPAYLVLLPAWERVLSRTLVLRGPPVSLPSSAA